MLREHLRRLGPESVKFLIVGCSNTIIGYSVYRIGLAAPVDFRFKAAISQLVGYALGTAWSFYFNSRWTFKSTTPVKRRAARFTALQLALWLVSAASIGLTVDVMGLPPTLSWLAIMAVLTVVNFLASRYWAFQ